MYCNITSVMCKEINKLIKYSLYMIVPSPGGANVQDCEMRGCSTEKLHCLKLFPPQKIRF